MEALKQAMIRAVPEDFEQKTIHGQLVSPDDTVLLVMPQDIQAPKGRLILPQVQTIRDLLDNQCVVLCTHCQSVGYGTGSLGKAAGVNHYGFSSVSVTCMPKSRKKKAA